MEKLATLHDCGMMSKGSATMEATHVLEPKSNVPRIRRNEGA